jgi:hypothetical protein
MSRWESVLIDTEESIEVVARLIGEFLSARFTYDQEGDLVASFGRTAGVWLRDADFEDEPGLPLSSYRYALLIRDTDHTGAHHYAAQEDTARRVYDTLVARTSWRLRLLFDDMQLPVARRNAHTAA